MPLRHRSDTASPEPLPRHLLVGQGGGLGSSAAAPGGGTLLQRRRDASGKTPLRQSPPPSNGAGASMKLTRGSAPAVGPTAMLRGISAPPAPAPAPRAAAPAAPATTSARRAASDAQASRAVPRLQVTSAPWAMSSVRPMPAPGHGDGQGAAGRSPEQPQPLQARRSSAAEVHHVQFRGNDSLASVHLINQEMPADARLSRCCPSLATTFVSTALMEKTIHPSCLKGMAEAPAEPRTPRGTCSLGSSPLAVPVAGIAGAAALVAPRTGGPRGGRAEAGRVPAKPGARAASADAAPTAPWATGG